MKYQIHNNLLPFFYYFGGKRRIAKHYPKPIHDTIIEPFAGSAGYSLYYSWKKILLFDIDPVICGIWDYLIKASRNEILRLPTIIEDVRDLHVCQEAKWLIGFWLNQGTNSPRYIPSKWMRSVLKSNRSHFWWGKMVKQRIAFQIEFIRHWKIKQAKYREVENRKATWFIDPPYQNNQSRPGRQYVYNWILSYQHLSEWSKDRLGQSIVCEQEGANWLPFSSFRHINGQRKSSKEVVWYRQ